MCAVIQGDSEGNMFHINIMEMAQFDHPLKKKIVSHFPFFLGTNVSAPKVNQDWSSRFNLSELVK